jgi:hypothetical protein
VTTANPACASRPADTARTGRIPATQSPGEAAEELQIDARFHRGLGAGRPLFLTVTPTLGTPSHTDVSLWFVLDVDIAAELRPDPGEYNGVRWFGFDEKRDWPGDVYDPQMHRFARKLTAVLGL